MWTIIQTSKLSAIYDTLFITFLYKILYWTSHSGPFWKKRYSENLGKIIEKHLWKGSVFSKVSGQKSIILPRMNSFTVIFQVEFWKKLFFRTPQNSHFWLYHGPSQPKKTTTYLRMNLKIHFDKIHKVNFLQFQFQVKGFLHTFYATNYVLQMLSMISMMYAINDVQWLKWDLIII